MKDSFDKLDYTLKRSQRKTMSIYVERDGSVSVLAPDHLEIEKLNKIIENKLYWIYKSIAELEELNKSKIDREIVDGEGFFFLGKSHRLRIGECPNKSLSLSEGYFTLNFGNIKNAKKCFVNFYKIEGSKHLPKRVNYFKEKLGVNPKSIRIMDLQNRWASWSNDKLNFHWKIMLAPLSVIDYIIVHELAHLIELNHTSKFWEIVESIMPDYNDKKNWLKLNGASLDL